jgi:protoporphyrinogen oxidase
MWERATEQVLAAGGEVRMGTAATRLHRAEGRVVAVDVRTTDDAGQVTGEDRLPADEVISSMPLPELVLVMDPPAPEHVQQAARALSHRDFLTVALVVPEEGIFPDNWIYIHAPEVEVGRIQNYGSWSPFMVKEGRTCLGLEYFVFEGDEMWTKSDDDLIEQAKREIAFLGLVDPAKVELGHVVRVPKAYPTYDTGYLDRIETMRKWVEANASNVHPVGRNGMHRYNNQDHSMYTAMLTVENILGRGPHDIWSVNVEQEYHEEKGGGSHGTGRDAPVLPERS